MNHSPEFLTLARLRAVVVALVVVFAVSVVDALRHGASIAVEAAFALAAIATGVLTFLIVDAVRAAFRLRGGPRRELAVSGFEGLFMGGWAFVADPLASLEGPRSIGVAIGLAVVAIAQAALDLRFRRLGDPVVAGVGVAAFASHVLTTPASYGSFHAAACVTTLACVARLGSLRSAAAPLRPAFGIAVAALALVAANLALLSPEVRARFWWSSPTASALARPLVELTDLDRDGGASGFGTYDCGPFDAARGPFALERPDDGVDQDCDQHDAHLPAPGPAPRPTPTNDRPDVLVLSLDALRADAAPRLDAIRRALGEPYEFTVAVAPSVRTMNSFAAMVRGRALDELPFGRESLRSTLRPNALPTIGQVLTRGGYRSVFVATHAYLAPRTRIVTGAEFLRETAMPYDDPSRRGLAAMLDGDDAIDLLLGAARTTEGPLFAWTHLMETHEPYRESRARVFGTTRADYDRAIELADDRVARAIDAFRALRNRPVVVVVLGDHGEAFGEHGLAFHSSSVHAEQARVPFFVSIPGVAGRRIDAPVSTAALAATLTELAGLPIEPSFHTPSLGPCLASDAACPTHALTELFVLARPGDAAMRAYTTATERVLVDRAHDIAQHFDRIRDPGERSPRTTDAHRVPD